eukprot:9335991-Pyramimonas_sp.AAC.1
MPRVSPPAHPLTMPGRAAEIKEAEEHAVDQTEVLDQPAQTQGRTSRTSRMRKGGEEGRGGRWRG